MHKKALEDIESEIDDFKMSLGPRVLKLTMAELKKMKNVDDFPVSNQAIDKLNKTLMENLNLNKNDEGKLMLFKTLILINNLIYFRIWNCDCK